MLILLPGLVELLFDDANGVWSYSKRLSNWLEFIHAVYDFRNSLLRFIPFREAGGGCQSAEYSLAHIERKRLGGFEPGHRLLLVGRCSACVKR